MSDLPTLRIACADLDARPLFWTEPDGARHGYEPDAAELVLAEAGYALEWVFLQWKDFLPSVVDGSVDGVWCGMGIIPEREAIVDFTDPYTVFNESVVMREGSTATSPEELAGQRIGAIAESANMRLARTFEGVVLVPFDGATDDVFGDMIAALRAGEIDGFVDDDVVMVPLGQEPDLRLAFTVDTRNPWGMAVRQGNDELRLRMNAALDAVKDDGRLRAVWSQWLPEDLAYPF
jgi:polar amino acid transport system substrate-binding protein